ncbi:hypothetical protein [Streptomyces sp. NPDC056387]|uniref:hypothetical protein n=1 Tax=Streptomyces sp. NPDC056387 TaxID=3345803 RepID=UPI0035DC251D
MRSGVLGASRRTTSLSISYGSIAASWGSRDVLGAILVRPELVAEISADRADDHGGIFRHPLRFKRLRLDVAAEDVPRFGTGPSAAAG